MNGYKPSSGNRQKTLWHASQYLLILTILASLLPQSPAAAVVCKYKHKVLEGETLIYIGNLYQVYWLNIAKANNIQPPYNVAPGTILCIPGGEDPGTAQTKKKKEPILIVLRAWGMSWFPSKISLQKQPIMSGCTPRIEASHTGSVTSPQIKKVIIQTGLKSPSGCTVQRPCRYA